MTASPTKIELTKQDGNKIEVVVDHIDHIDHVTDAAFKSMLDDSYFNAVVSFRGSDPLAVRETKEEVLAKIAYNTNPAVQKLRSVYERAKCDVPPPGWRCTREAGHDRPCAAAG